MPNRATYFVVITVDRPTNTYSFGGVTLTVYRGTCDCLAKNSHRYDGGGDYWASKAAIAAKKYGSTSYLDRDYSREQVAIELVWQTPRHADGRPANALDRIPHPTINAEGGWGNETLAKVNRALGKLDLSSFRTSNPDAPTYSMLDGIEGILTALRAKPAVYDDATREFHEISRVDAMVLMCQQMRQHGMLTTDSDESAA